MADIYPDHMNRLDQLLHWINDEGTGEQDDKLEQLERAAHMWPSVSVLTPGVCVGIEELPEVEDPEHGVVHIVTGWDGDLYSGRWDE